MSASILTQATYFSSLTDLWLTSDLSCTSTVLPGPNPLTQSEVKSNKAVAGESDGEATGLGFENRSPRNKCIQDALSLPEDFRALVWLRTEAGLPQRKTGSLETGALLTFVEIVR